MPLSLHAKGTAGIVLVAVAVLSASASASACSNEALRSELRSGGLSDCRAYERVTPAYKESAIFTSTFAVAPDGARVITGSLGTFAGTEQLALNLKSNVAGGAYLLSRTQSGWAAASLNPPSSLYNSNGMLDSSLDLDATLWALEPLPGQGQPNLKEANLYLEQPLGMFTKIGPITPQAAGPNMTGYFYAGASQTLGRVLFSVSPGFRWPYDGTVAEGSTLYEYMGVEGSNELSHEPTLVGVEGGLGSETLVSRCGTRLGSNSLEERDRELGGVPTRGSTYNAISADGTRVFFTAVGMDEAGGCEGPPAGELLAREKLPLVSGAPSPAGMHTVPISEPEAKACRVCLTGGEAKDAVFQGASLDGSKVFFTTEQGLLPGAEGRNLYEYDFDAPVGEQVTLLTGGAGDPQVQGVARISEDGSHVYFVASGSLTGAVPNGIGERAAEGADNLYVYAEGRTSFVATLAAGDAGDWSRIDERPVQVSGEGRFLVFTSLADLTGEGLEEPMSQVFQYDATTGVLARASIGQDGYNDDGRKPAAGSQIVNGFPSAYSYSTADSPAAASGVQAPANGAVFFESPDALTPAALADRTNQIGQLILNIYEYRAGHVYLLSDGHDLSVVNGFLGTYLVGSDPAGDDVFFFTSDPLIPADGDTQQDLYDARAEGGFPMPSSPPACAGEACRGALTGAVTLALPGGSATQAAEGDASAPVAPAKVKRKATRAKRKPKSRGRRKRESRARTGRARASHRLHEKRAG